MTISHSSTVVRVLCAAVLKLVAFLIPSRPQSRNDEKCRLAALHQRYSLLACLACHFSAQFLNPRGKHAYLGEGGGAVAANRLVVCLLRLRWYDDDDDEKSKFNIILVKYLSPSHTSYTITVAAYSCHGSSASVCVCVCMLQSGLNNNCVCVCGALIFCRPLSSGTARRHTWAMADRGRVK